jgi:hypothetical protein
MSIAFHTDFEHCVSECENAWELQTLLNEKAAEGWTLQSWQPRSSAWKEGEIVDVTTGYVAVWLRPLERRA